MRIMKTFTAWVFSVLLATLVYASTPSVSETDRRLMQEFHDINQMWIMSENYRYGITIPQDLSLAYAWLTLYIDSLPANYPGIADMLAELAEQMTETEMVAANAFVMHLRELHRIDRTLNEKELQQIFALFDMEEINFVEDVDVIDHNLSFEQLLDRLREDGQEALADQLAVRMQVLQTQASQSRGQGIAFGQVMVAGPENPQNVLSRVQVYPGGYFLALLRNRKDSVRFVLSGYQPIQITRPNTGEPIVNVGVIKLEPVALEDQAAVIGRIGADDVSSTKVVLWADPFRANERDEDIEWRNPWWHPIIPAVQTPEGEFFLTGLTPMNYRLVISNNGQITANQRVQLAPGEVRDLGEFAIPATG